MNIEDRGDVSPQISGCGTPESAWRDCETLRQLPEFTLPRTDLAIVLAPHPDDETLGLGGTIASLLDRGSTVLVLTASDGEASHPHSVTTSPEQLRVRRQEELRRAIDTLSDGRPGQALNVKLHLPDGGLAGVERELGEHLYRFLDPGVLCFSTWAQDGHPDHEAVGRAAHVACARSGARLIEYPVWTWHWAVPNEETVPWWRAQKVNLSPRTISTKWSAIKHHESQINPLSERPGDEAVVPPFDLLHFERSYEVLFV